MYKFCVLTTGYAESGAIAQVILRCDNPDPNLSKREFMQKLAKDLFRAWIYPCEFCENSNTNNCDVCGVPLRTKFIRNDYIDFVNEIFRGTADSWPDEFYDWTPWFEFKELMQTKMEEIVVVQESTAEVLASLLNEDDVTGGAAKRQLANWRKEFTYPNISSALEKALRT